MAKQKITDTGKLAKQLHKNDKYLIVENPNGVYPRQEYYLLRPTPHLPLNRLTAVLLDMDGTLTTTEELNVHALGSMAGTLLPETEQAQWGGLDPITDIPAIVGTSTTKSVEYLLGKYGRSGLTKSFLSAYFSAVLSALSFPEESPRLVEVRQTLATVFGTEMSHRLLQVAGKTGKQGRMLANDTIRRAAEKLASEMAQAKRRLTERELVRCAVDIFFDRYQYIIRMVAERNETALAKLLGAEKARRPIQPIDGVLPFLLVLRGLLPDNFELCNSLVAGGLNRKEFARMMKFSRMFSKRPVKVALVTSSTYYEAKIVLDELFLQLRRQIQQWQLPAAQQKQCLALFSNPDSFFQVIVTANDSSEIRLKPHRDLYTIALSKLGLGEAELDSVIGFEDSTSGTMALRAAGVGLSIAVPFTQTSGQNFEAAHFVLRGGLMDAIITHNLFLA
jgi:beta-phosphoglucomutase-like phosphatase (HAD superfamily)